MKTLTTEELANEIEAHTNVMGNHEECQKIVRHLLNMHRTLGQQYTSNFVLPFIKGMRDMYANGYYDARNEQACKLCSIMWSALCKELGFEENREISLALI